MVPQRWIASWPDPERAWCCLLRLLAKEAQYETEGSYLPKPRSRSRPCERAAARVRYSTPRGSGNRREFVDQALHAGWEERGLVLDPNSHLRPGIPLLMAPSCAARVAEAPAVLSASLVQGKPAPAQEFRWKVCDSMCLVLQTSKALWNAPSGWCSGS